MATMRDRIKLEVTKEEKKTADTSKNDFSPELKNTTKDKS